MKWPKPLQQGRLIKRYKRFLADIVTDDGRLLTLHCANTGSMRNCGEEGSKVWFWDSEDPKRKLPCTWELVETAPGEVACINTQRANRLVEEAVIAGDIPTLSGYRQVRREVKYGHENSRIDLLLQDGAQADCFIEVKSVTLKEDGLGYFPDAVSVRASKHLRELVAMVEEGKRAVIFFCVCHSGIDNVTPAWHIDPDYARLLLEVAEQGVEVLAWQVAFSEEGMQLHKELPVLLMAPVSRPAR